QRHLLVLRRLQNRVGEWMLGALLDRGRPLEHIRRRDGRAVGLLGGDDVRDRRLALGDRAGLVEQHAPRVRETLERFPTPYQYPVLGRPPGADENGGGRSEPQRA